MKKLILLMGLFLITGCDSGSTGPQAVNADDPSGSGGGTTVSAPSAPDPAPTNAIPANAVLLMHLDGDVSDATGNTTPTDHGTTQVADAAVGTGARHFDGSLPSYIEIGAGPSYDFNGSEALTLSFWIRTTSNNPMYVLGQSDSACTYNVCLPTDRGFSISVDINTHALQVLMPDGGFGMGFNSPAPSSVIPINDGQWHFVEFTRSGSDAWLKVDSRAAGAFVNLPPVTSRTNAFTLGRDGQSPVYPFTGDLDEVQITQQ